jgi:outer membrane immunogenic protein
VCGAPEAGRITKTAVGWTLGAGGEGKLSDAFSVRVEYRYAGFERSNLNFFQGVNSGADSFSAKADPSSHIVTLGITYHFGGL